MTVRGLTFATIGLILSVWVFGSWVANDMKRAEERAQAAEVAAPGDLTTDPGAQPATAAPSGEI